MTVLEEFVKEMKKEEMNKGIKIGKNLVAKAMVKYKMPEEDIIKYTHLSKEELKELKLQMV